MGTTYYTEDVLARRWGVSERTIQKWRVQGRGPAFHKFGSSVRYAEEDIEAYEAEQRRRSTSDPGRAE